MSDRPLESAIGYSFKNKDLLEIALTHCSITQATNNERLEFLGDAILGATAASILFEQHPELPEGELTRLRSQLVQGSTLAALARTFGLDKHLQHAPSTSISERMLAGGVEAIAGAILIDAGHTKASKIFAAWIEQLATLAFPTSTEFNAKGALQELLQPAIAVESIEYRCVATEGPPHARVYTVELWVKDKKLATATGSTKKSAENSAAASAVRAIKEKK